MLIFHVQVDEQPMNFFLLPSRVFKHFLLLLTTYNKHLQVWLTYRLHSACLCYPPPSPHFNSFQIIFVFFTKSPPFTGIQNISPDKCLCKCFSGFNTGMFSRYDILLVIKSLLGYKFFFNFRRVSISIIHGILRFMDSKL